MLCTPNPDSFRMREYLLNCAILMKGDQDEVAFYSTANCLCFAVGGFLALEEAIWKYRCSQGSPERIQADNDPEFISRDLERRAYWNIVELCLSRSGKPIDNAMIEALILGFVRNALMNTGFYRYNTHTKKLKYGATNTTKLDLVVHSPTIPKRSML